MYEEYKVNRDNTTGYP